MTKAARRSLKAPASKEQHVAEEALSSGEAALSSAETAQYIAEFAAELSFLARRSKLDLLAYLLDMARLEAVRALQEEDRKR